MSQTIWIARHANRLDFVRPEWFNTADRPYDPPLSEDGFVQAERLARRLQGTSIRHIFCSPFLRTVQTAHAVANLLDLPLYPEWGLAEWLNPDWMPHMPDTLPLETLAEAFPRIDTSYKSRLFPHYPESEGEMFARGQEIAQRLVAEFSEDLLMVGHGATVLGTAQGLVGTEANKVRASLCCLVKIVCQEAQWVMELSGDTSHLEDSETEIRFA